MKAAALPKEKEVIFYICEMVAEEGIPVESREYYAKICQLNKLNELEHGVPQQHWVGANGHMLFEGRSLSLMASSMRDKGKIEKDHKEVIKNYQQVN